MGGVTVLGVGSPQGADRLGWDVLELLRGALAGRGPAGVELHALDRPGAALLEYLGGRELVVVVDAVALGEPRGTLVRLEGGAIEDAPARVSSHGFGVADALGLARALGTGPRRLIVLGLEPGDAPATPFAAEEVERLAQAVLAEVERGLGAAPSP